MNNETKYFPLFLNILVAIYLAFSLFFQRPGNGLQIEFGTVIGAGETGFPFPAITGDAKRTENTDKTIIGSMILCFML